MRVCVRVQLSKKRNTTVISENISGRGGEGGFFMISGSAAIDKTQLGIDTRGDFNYAALRFNNLVNNVRLKVGEAFLSGPIPLTQK